MSWRLDENLYPDTYQHLLDIAEPLSYPDGVVWFNSLTGPDPGFGPQFRHPNGSSGPFMPAWTISNPVASPSATS